MIGDDQETRFINQTTDFSFATAAAGGTPTDVLAYLGRARDAPLTMQMLRCNIWCAATKLHLVEKFSDKAVSGTTDPLQRPGFSALITRNPRHVRSIIEMLQQHGVGLLTARGERIEPVFFSEFSDGRRLKRARGRPA